MKNTVDTTEIFRLEQMLKDADIPFEKQELFGGYQIGYPVLPLLPPYDECKCSVIQHHGSYGHNNNLLEVMESTENGKLVEGWLTAEEIFNRISRHHNSCDSQE